MMRRDAKIGFVIGGILLAVLIVYVLVPSGKKHTTGAVLDEGSKTDQSAANSTGTPSTPDASSADAVKTADASKTPDTATTPDAAAAIPAGPTTAPVATATDPFSTAGTDQSKGTAEDKWMLALNHGNVPPAMMTSAPQLPSPANSSGKSRKAAADATAIKSVSLDSTPQVATPPAAPSDSTASADNTAAPATQPVGTGKMNTHVVQAGETISSIAKVAYGSANYWPYIIRANPGIVATKIRPGMTINMPLEADVKAGSANAVATSSTGSAGSATAAEDAKIDPNTQYQVQAGDSLAKIAMKLYGSSNKWQPIYDLNKDAIGNDPQKLKQKMVLKLPEPPTVKS